MADRNLDVALVVKTHLEQAVRDLNRLEKEVGDTGRAADRDAARVRRLATAAGTASRARWRSLYFPGFAGARRRRGTMRAGIGDAPIP